MLLEIEIRKTVEDIIHALEEFEKLKFERSVIESNVYILAHSNVTYTLTIEEIIRFLEEGMETNVYVRLTRNAIPVIDTTYESVTPFIHRILNNLPNIIIQKIKDGCNVEKIRVYESNSETGGVIA